MLINWLEFKGSGRRVKNIFETTTSVHTQCCWSTVSARERVWNITALNWFQNAACIARVSCTRLPAPHQRSYCSGQFDVTASKEWSGRCATDRSVSQCRRGVHSEMCMFVRQCMRACVRRWAYILSLIRRGCTGTAWRILRCGLRGWPIF